MNIINSIVGLMGFKKPVAHLLTPLTPPSVTVGGNCWGLCMSPNGSNIYTINYSLSTIGQYSRNSTTGQMTTLTPASIASGFSRAAVVSPDGKSLYSGTYDGKVYQYSRNTTTGLLAALSPTYKTTNGNAISAMVVSPDGKNVYTAGTGYIFQFSRNTTTGVLTPLSTPSINLGGLTGGISISSDGNFVYCSSGVFIYQFSRNSTTGLLSPLSPATVSAGVTPNSNTTGNLNMNTLSPDGNFFYATCSWNNSGLTLNNWNIYMFSRNSTTGQLTPLSIPYVNLYAGPQSIVVSPDGLSVFAGGIYNAVYQFSRDLTTGEILPLTPDHFYPPNYEVFGIISSPDSNFVYVSSYSDGKIFQYSRS